MKSKYPTLKQLKILRKQSKSSTFVSITRKFENLNLELDDLKPNLNLLQKKMLLRCLYRDIDFLCFHGIVGYKLQVLVEENLTDKMMDQYVQRLGKKSTLENRI